MAASQQNTTQFQYGEESASDYDQDVSDEDEPLRPVHLSSFPTPIGRSPSLSNISPLQHDHPQDVNIRQVADEPVEVAGRQRRPSFSSLSYCKSLSYSYSHPESDGDRVIDRDRNGDPNRDRNREQNREREPNGIPVAVAAPSAICRSQSDLYPAPSRSVASPELRNWLSRYALDCIYHDLIENGYDCLLVLHCIRFVTLCFISNYMDSDGVCSFVILSISVILCHFRF